ncbi:MAG: HAD-IA family hydrolase [Candidatus Thermoplasmatota archaeon]|nr:HAD-IA family hydrolase [Candidatus Thermoplasmatota archaeon]
MKVFFDFGGTLMDEKSDERAHEELMKAIEKRYGFKAEELLASYKRAMQKNVAGGEWHNTLEIAQDWFLSWVKNGPTNWFLEEYFRMHKMYVRLNEGAIELLEAFAPVGLISDADKQYIDFQIKPIRRYFFSVTTSEEAGYAKPNRRIFELALSRSGLSARECVYVGNSVERDIRGAKALGFKTVLVFGQSDEADYCAKDLFECREILESIQAQEGMRD